MRKNNLNIVIKKLKNKKVETNPFPHILIKNFIPEKLFYNFVKSLPNYNDLEGKNIFIQSKSKTKRSIFYESKFFKKIMKENLYFKEIIFIFKNLEKHLNILFKKHLIENINEDYNKLNSVFSCSFSSSVKNYIKSAHIDRREHKYHLLYYPQIQMNKGGEICLWSSKKKKVYDVFPDKKKIKISKEIIPQPNSCLISLNTPFSYHSVKKYFGEKERKYLYTVFDFPTSNENYKLSKRKKGNNNNVFWKYPVRVFSKKRMLNFVNE